MIIIIISSSIDIITNMIIIIVFIMTVVSVITSSIIVLSVISSMLSIWILIKVFGLSDARASALAPPTPNLPTEIIPAKICWLKSSRNIPYGPGNSTL